MKKVSLSLHGGIYYMFASTQNSDVEVADVVWRAYERHCTKQKKWQQFIDTLNKMQKRPVRDTAQK